MATALLNFTVQGELTIATATQLRTDLLQALDEADEIEVDLAQVTEIDSAGVQLMLAAKREAAERQKALRFIAHSPAVLDTLDLADLGGCLGDPVLIQSRN